MRDPTANQGLTAAPSGKNNTLAERLKAATDLLESIAGNRALLAELSIDERTRLLKAAGEIYCPDVSERRRLVKAKVRRRKADKLERDQTRLNQTGIRTLRKKP